MLRLSVYPLPDERVDEAYPLVRAVTKISPRRWAAYARLLKRQLGKVLAAIDGEGNIYGVATCRSGNTLRHQQSLIVDLIAAFELGPEANVKARLCEALKGEAEARGCKTLVISASPPRALSTDLNSGDWEKLGLRVEAITVAQDIAPGDQIRK